MSEPLYALSNPAPPLAAVPTPPSSGCISFVGSRPDGGCAVATRSLATTIWPFEFNTLSSGTGQKSPVLLFFTPVLSTIWSICAWERSRAARNSVHSVDLPDFAGGSFEQS